MNILSALKNRVEIVDNSVTSRDLVNRFVAQGPQEEPLHLTEVDSLVKRHYEWSLHLPRVEPFYAIKSNDEASLVEATVLLGCGYDCASMAEVRRMLELGVDRRRIIFAQPQKTIVSLQYAREKRILTVFDSACELKKIHQYYPEAEVLIRYRFDSRNSVTNLGVKFGCETEKESKQLLNLAKELGINVIGWCFNVGSGCRDASIFYDAIKKGREIHDYATTIGFKFTMIDLGGGFLGDKGNGISQYADYINRALDECYPKEENVSIIAEPGRFYCAAAVTTIIPVHGKRVLFNDNDPLKIEHISYYFNDGMYGTFYSAKYRNQKLHPIIWKSGVDLELTYRTTLFGPTCDGNDAFAKDLDLPQLEVSDFVIFENQGAYARVHSCRFNGFCLPKVTNFIRKRTWELLETLSKSPNPTQVLLNNEYLQKNYNIEKLTFEAN
ncbi:ornithine decarboxylase-like [Armigeres subalbatus]|uniref:ornithine decarboxylase-like n=1 Tax=Armigeres subalbatus TaxID=124917 RepID=UPI002ED696FD